jgi:tRNA (guanine-N7-)-methyltransferase
MAETKETGKGYQPKKRTRIPDKDGDNDDGPITIEGEMPKKTFYRSRAHVNPLSHNNAFAYPVAPSQHDWAPYYPTSNGTPTIVDVGCGFGGLTVALAELYPEECSLGMEIRAKVALFKNIDTYTYSTLSQSISVITYNTFKLQVCEYVRLRIEALRAQQPGNFQNVSVLRTNSMRCVLCVLCFFSQKKY